MDTLIASGDHAVDGRGLPVAVDGIRELVQRAMIRLAVKKGSFALDPGLGSELYRLGGERRDTRDRVALSYVQEALAPLKELRVEAVRCRQPDSQRLTVEVDLAATGPGHYRLEVPLYG